MANHNVDVTGFILRARDLAYDLCVPLFPAEMVQTAADDTLDIHLQNGYRLQYLFAVSPGMTRFTAPWLTSNKTVRTVFSIRPRWPEDVQRDFIKHVRLLRLFIGGLVSVHAAFNSEIRSEVRIPSIGSGQFESVLVSACMPGTRLEFALIYLQEFEASLSLRLRQCGGVLADNTLAVVHYGFGAEDEIAVQGRLVPALSAWKAQLLSEFRKLCSNLADPAPALECDVVRAL